MKKLFIPLMLFSFNLLAQVQAPYLCQLSISSPSGQSSMCNAVHIGGGRLLSASHCFPEGKNTITHGIVLASCGGEEFMDFTNLKRTPDPVKGSFSEDMALLEFSPVLKTESIRPTEYPAMYFASNQLRSGVQCEILAFRGSYPSKALTRIKFNDAYDVRVMDNGSGPAQIIMKNKSGGTLPSGINVKEGDSGGALVCRYSKTAREELVGIIMSYGTDKVSKQIIQNSFSPVFGNQAKKYY
jgi:hypothetical protein